MNKKNRPKYIQKMIDEVNLTFRSRNEKDEHCDLMMWWIGYLCHNKWYRGFNFYKRAYKDGKEISILAGTADKNLYDYIQLW